MYLSELMKDTELKQNTIIISPVGSGKTTYILDVLCQEKKCLYLCDNLYLKQQTLQERNWCHENGRFRRGFDNINTDVTITTYSKFGKDILVNKDDVSNYDYVFCDEIHSLYEYYSYNKDIGLGTAMSHLFKQYENTKIAYFTATPYYLQRFQEEYKGYLDFCEIYDFSDSDIIHRDVNIREGYFSHISRIPWHLQEYKEAFKYRGMKVVIYTKRISDMKYIEGLLKDINLKPICLWSTNAKEEEMTTEQLIVRKHLIDTGEIMKPYNVLIINKACETGVNIRDEKIRVVVVNSTNLTEITQVRGRVRHDIDLLLLKADKDVKEVITLEDEWLDKPLTKADKDKLVEEVGVRDKNSNIVKWTGLKKILQDSGYEIKDKTLKRKGERYRVSIITKKSKK